jgi:hypothetical protein
MGYDVTQPTNTTKIRNLGTVIRPNWIAIVQADATFKPYAINLANRTSLPIPADPAVIADTYLLYSKKDGAGNVQVYVENPAAKVTKLTSNIVPSPATNGYTYLPGDILLQWGKHTAVAAGNTDVFFPVAFSGAPYSMTITLYRSSGASAQGLYITSHVAPDATHFLVYNDSGSNREFFWQAVGPKS